MVGHKEGLVGLDTVPVEVPFACHGVLPRVEIRILIGENEPIIHRPETGLMLNVLVSISKHGDRGDRLRRDRCGEATKNG